MCIPSEDTHVIQLIVNHTLAIENTILNTPTCRYGYSHLLLNSIKIMNSSCTLDICLSVK